MTRARKLAALALIASFVGACAPAATPIPPTRPATARPTQTVLPPTETQPAPTISPASSPSTASTSSPASSLSTGQARAVASASEDLAGRAGVKVEDVVFLRLITDDLPGSDLGCPGAGTKSAVQPAFVSGWIIFLSAAEQQYEYRAHASQVVFCGQRPAGTP
jgi:hypothetical protein